MASFTFLFLSPTFFPPPPPPPPLLSSSFHIPHYVTPPPPLDTPPAFVRHSREGTVQAERKGVEGEAQTRCTLLSSHPLLSSSAHLLVLFFALSLLLSSSSLPPSPPLLPPLTPSYPLLASPLTRVPSDLSDCLSSNSYLLSVLPPSLVPRPPTSSHAVFLLHRSS
jgi:hypothetical protein